MFSPTFEAQIDILKLIEASEDHCAPIIFYANISGKNTGIEIGTEGDFVDIRELAQALQSVTNERDASRSYFYEGMSIVKTRVDMQNITSKFRGKVVIASLSWGS